MIPMDSDNSHVHIVIPRPTTKIIQTIDSKMLLNKDEILKQCSNNTEARKKRERKENERRQAEKQITK